MKGNSESVEEIFDTDLHLPALAAVLIVLEALGRISSIDLDHREDRFVLVVHTLVFENTAIAAVVVHAVDTPLGVDEVADIHDIEAELDGVGGGTYTELEFFHDAEVEAVCPWPL